MSSRRPFPTTGQVIPLPLASNQPQADWPVPQHQHLVNLIRGMSEYGYAEHQLYYPLVLLAAALTRKDAAQDRHLRYIRQLLDAYRARTKKNEGMLSVADYALRVASNDLITPDDVAQYLRHHLTDLPLVADATRPQNGSFMAGFGPPCLKPFDVLYPNGLSHI